ncbi:hypothetical protein BC938DRAFT_470707 [Jimgerdemannia flammicorona]|uniref:Uncharacterized protein n=1 Tax=Jimgerdemannia flammicorona TaxID=994334 RepID=A0A433Q9L8_9FUNG|nr:hypothetical protein BC938DRAFT_470707 [Jimgerdemannia flammicorona]
MPCLGALIPTPSHRSQAPVRTVAPPCLLGPVVIERSQMMPWVGALIQTPSHRSPATVQTAAPLCRVCPGRSKAQPGCSEMMPCLNALILTPSHGSPAQRLRFVVLALVVIEKGQIVQRR